MLITAPNFMKECDFVLDQTVSKTVNLFPSWDNKKVFLNTDMFEWALPKLCESSNVTLVMHHSDRFFTRIMLEAAKPHVNRILAQNCEIDHPLITQIPIGVGYDWRAPNEPPRITEDRFHLIRAMNVPRDNERYVAVSLHLNNEVHFEPVRRLRQRCISFFPDQSNNRLDIENYLLMLRRTKFVICPMGMGLDTHRVYEAAYMGARPVVIHSGLDNLYRKFGAIILNDWSDPLPEWTPPDVPEELFHTGFWMAN